MVFAPADGSGMLIKKDSPFRMQVLPSIGIYGEVTEKLRLAPRSYGA